MDVERGHRWLSRCGMLSLVILMTGSSSGCFGCGDETPEFCGLT